MRGRDIPAPAGFLGCTRCLAIKPREEFSKAGKRTGSYCLPCKAAMTRERRDMLKQRTEIDQATIDRFWSRVDKDAPDGHWLWTGCQRNKDGYGSFELNGVTTQPHQVVYRLAGIQIPDGMCVDHVCRVRKCCNPDHLRIVPLGVNSRENNLSPHAINSRKIACSQGHPFTPDNTRYYTPKYQVDRHGKKRPGRPMRLCIACYRARAAKHYAKKAALKSTSGEGRS